MEQKIIIELSTNELRTNLEEATGMYSKMKLNHAVSPIENPMKLRKTYGKSRSSQSDSKKLR